MIVVKYDSYDTYNMCDTYSNSLIDWKMISYFYSLSGGGKLLLYLFAGVYYVLMIWKRHDSSLK